MSLKGNEKYLMLIYSKLEKQEQPYNCWRQVDGKLVPPIVVMYNTIIDIVCARINLQKNFS
jgi:hypothetical protein